MRQQLRHARTAMVGSHASVADSNSLLPRARAVSFTISAAWREGGWTVSDHTWREGGWTVSDHTRDAGAFAEVCLWSMPGRYRQVDASDLARTTCDRTWIVHESVGEHQRVHVAQEVRIRHPLSSASQGQSVSDHTEIETRREFCASQEIQCGG